jgi:hypothetical protein
LVNVEPYDEGLDYYPLAEKLVDKGFKPYLVNLHSQKALSAANLEFITGSSTELSVVMGGSSTKVDIISASTDDKSALSGHTRQVRFWGINDSDNLILEARSLSGTTAVSGTNVYKEINDFAGFLYGTTTVNIHDAKGNIDIGQTGKVTNEVLRIAANDNTILTSRIWIPKNWRARIVHGHVNAGDGTTGRSSGVLVFPQWYDALHQEEDGSRETQAFFHESTKVDETVWDKTYGSDDTMGKLTFFGQRINNSDTWNLHATVLIWATHHIASTQKRDIAGLG